MNSSSSARPIDFEIGKEVWNKYELISDNAYLKTRIIVVGVFQTLNENDPNKGDYSGEISNIISVLPFKNFNLKGSPSSMIYGKEDFEKARSVEVDFKIIQEDWNVYRLNDGSKLKVRQVVATIKRMLDMYDSHGLPIYIVDSTNIINVDLSERRLST